MLPTPHPVVVNAYTIINSFIICTSLISNLLSLQTFLASKKIRKTNSWCIFNCFLNILSTCQCLDGNKSDEIEFWDIYCNIFATRRVLSFGELLYSLHWLNSFIAAERCLIQCYDVSLYDSRIRRSTPSISALIIVQIIVNSFPNVFCRQSDKVVLNACGSDLTSTGKN